MQTIPFNYTFVGIKLETNGKVAFEKYMKFALQTNQSVDSSG